MLEVEFQEWLKSRGAKTQAGLNSRIYAVKTIEKNLAALGSPHADLDAAYQADGFAQLRQRIKEIRRDAKDNGNDYRLLMPESEQPLNRLSNWNSWLGQYGRFLSGDDSQADEIRDYVLENYITPARERGDASVTLVVGPLNTEMGLDKGWPNICQALDGQKFQELADVPPPVTEGPKKSTTRKYTFILTEGSELVAQTKPTPNNLIFYGPPGTGKTTLAKVIANTTSARFTQLNATTAGKKDMEEVVKEAQQHLGMYGKKTILFVDEIHRFNKGQQDYLLPFVEDGTLVLIGATTENPYFEVNGALLSRSIIFELKSLEKKDIRKLLDRAVTDPVKGLGSYHAEVSEEALDFLADLAGGDARAALNAIELGVLTTERSADGKIHVDLETAQECIQKRVVRYDKTGDQHYDTISAFIKSMRGSDPDAAVYYLAKMLYAGEDIKFIARRIMICAAEDVGMADPQALVVATAAAQAVERIGMPEAQIILSEAVTYVATAPKSNTACEAVFAAMASVKKKKTSVPAHLQDAHYKGSQKLGHGVGYKYAHDYPNHYVEQQYMPSEIQKAKFYEPSDNGHEKEIKEWI